MREQNPGKLDAVRHFEMSSLGGPKRRSGRSYKDSSINEPWE